MGFADQKYYNHDVDLMADSNVATLTTSTASSTATVTAPFGIPSFRAPRRVAAIYVVVKTAPTSTSVGPTLVFLNGTNTFGFVTLVGTAVTAGATIVGTLTNTASLSTNTFTNTLPNGSTAVLTNTTTTNWTILGSGTGATVNAVNTSTASAGVMGAYEIWFDTLEQFVSPGIAASATYQP